MIKYDDNNNKIVQTPHADVAKKEVLLIQEANTKIKETIVLGVTYNHSKEVVQGKLNKIISRYVSQLPPSRQEKVRRSLVQNAQKDYFVFSQNISVINRNFATRVNRQTVPGFSINIFENTNALLTENRIRGYVTDERNGSAVIKDYQKQVRAVVKALTVDNPEIQLTDPINNKPYKMSTRNYAEMTVRYEKNLSDVKELKNKNVKLVWTSSHADASPRCLPYQGKLYSLDGTSGTTEDGIKYTPLVNALLGPKGDGNGIINGYNCRHYLIEYKPGSKAPVDYDRESVRKSNQINNRQRNYESNIRQLKLQERLARDSGDKELAQRLNKRWKIMELEYQKFSLENDRAYFPWRCSIMREEVINRTEWGDEQYALGKKEVREIAKEKLDKYIEEDIETHLIRTNFPTKEDIELYKEANEIKFYKKITNDEKFIKKENERISSVINLNNFLKDDVKLSKEYNDILEKDNLHIKIIHSSDKRQGTAVHISDGHSEIGNDINKINFINDSFINPIDLEVYNDKYHEDRFAFVTTYDSKHKIINFLDLKGNEMEFVTSMYLKNKNCDRIIKNNLIIFEK